MNNNSDLVITIRFIRSFTHRNIKNLVVKVNDANIEVKNLKILILEGNNYIFFILIHNE
jgi:hypothetical protein